MLDSDFFKNVTVLDGGMGQELLSRGLEPVSNLWSATAVINPKYHEMLIQTHLDFINAGASVILTNTFTLKKLRLRENDLEDRYQELNKKAGELAREAKNRATKPVFVGGSLPPQFNVYNADLGGDLELIKECFRSQAECLLPYVDFFYLDVLSSQKECEIAIEAIKGMGKPFVIGIHLAENGELPSGENYVEVAKSLKKHNPIGITASCVIYQNFCNVVKDLKDVGIPFGFKINGFSNIPTNWVPTKGENPNGVLGKRHDLTPAKLGQLSREFVKLGATIIGGCCETKPAHISELASVKRQFASTSEDKENE